MFQVREVINKDKKSSLVPDILTDLPEWFGIHEISRAYIEAALTTALATLGSFGMLAVMVFSAFGYEKITGLVIKGQLKNVSL